jgi:hypothetical protein
VTPGPGPAQGASHRAASNLPVNFKFMLNLKSLVLRLLVTEYQ